MKPYKTEATWTVAKKSSMRGATFFLENAGLMRKEEHLTPAVIPPQKSCSSTFSS